MSFHVRHRRMRTMRTTDFHVELTVENKEWMNTFLQPIGDLYIGFIYEDIPSEHGSEWDGEVAVFVA